MIKVNKENTRGKGSYGWLNANYSFSFSNYYNPHKIGFNSLKVINENFIEPSQGFSTHSHQNMEILTIVLKGELGHTDSLGNIKSLTPSVIQRMYAGTGISHSEFNLSNTEELNLLQIWIVPNVLNFKPEYQEKQIDFSKSYNLLASDTGESHSIKIYQNIEIFLINLNPLDSINLSLNNKDTYLHVIKGELNINNQHVINYGDSLEAKDIDLLEIKAHVNSTIIGFKFK